MSILFFHFDGTNNAPSDAFAPIHQDESITNVLKSHLLLGGGLNIADGRLSSNLPYRSFYYAGIGTYGNALERWLNASFAFEYADVARILNQAMDDFRSHFHGGIKRIVLIGFSRGAALARRFAALIDPLLNQPIVVQAVMDTVASIGWPSLDKSKRPSHDVVFEYSGYLPKCVTQALHLVALDEQRLAFRPTLFNHDQRVTEVWLPGAHSDVGGGYRRDAIADLSFSAMSTWLHRKLSPDHMIYQSLDRLPLLNQDEASYQHWSRLLQKTPSANGMVHYQERPEHLAAVTLAPRICQVWRNNMPCKTTSPLWHRSVYERMALTPSYRPLAQTIRPALGWITS